MGLEDLARPLQHCVTFKEYNVKELLSCHTLTHFILLLGEGWRRKKAVHLFTLFPGLWFGGGHFHCGDDMTSCIRVNLALMDMTNLPILFSKDSLGLFVFFFWSWAQGALTMHPGCPIRSVGTSTAHYFAWAVVTSGE